MSAPEDAITLEAQGKIAIITLNQPKKLNALNQELYFRLATLLREVAARDDIFITVLTGTGRYFSAYAFHPAPPCPHRIPSPRPPLIAAPDHSAAVPT